MDWSLSHNLTKLTKITHTFYLLWDPIYKCRKFRFASCKIIWKNTTCNPKRGEKEPRRTAKKKKLLFMSTIKKKHHTSFVFMKEPSTKYWDMSHAVNHLLIHNSRDKIWTFWQKCMFCWAKKGHCTLTPKTYSIRLQKY